MTTPDLPLMKSVLTLLANLAGTQYSGNIRWVFHQRCNVSDIQRTFREHFQGKYFLTNFRWTSCVKNVWFEESKCWSLANSSNHKAMFPEYTKSIPRDFVLKYSKDIPRILSGYKNVFISQKVEKVVLRVILWHF